MAAKRPLGIWCRLFDTRFLALLVLGLGGCGNGTSEPRDAGLDALDAASDASLAVDGAVEGCPVPLLESVGGRIVDQEGVGLAEASVVMCVRYRQGAQDLFVCLRPVDTDPDGRYEVPLSETIQCVTEATVRIARAGQATLYCPLDPSAGGALEAPAFEMFALPADGPTFGAEDEEIAVTADDGGEVRLRPSDITAPEGPDAVRLAAVDVATYRPCFLPADASIAALYAMEPEQEVPRPEGLSARLAGGALAPGTAIDLYLLGGLHPIEIDGSFVREGQWVRFASSTVGEDGFVETPAGAGLPLIGWFGAVVP